MDYMKFYFLFSNFRLRIIEIYKHGVTAVFTAPCHAGFVSLRIRRLKPTLHCVLKLKAEITVFNQSGLYI
jgi:hypothetical protein